MSRLRYLEIRIPGLIGDSQEANGCWDWNGTGLIPRHVQDTGATLPCLCLVHPSPPLPVRKTQITQPTTLLLFSPKILIASCLTDILSKLPMHPGFNASLKCSQVPNPQHGSLENTPQISLQGLGIQPTAYSLLYLSRVIWFLEYNN